MRLLLNFIAMFIFWAFAAKLLIDGESNLEVYLTTGHVEAAVKVYSNSILAITAALFSAVFLNRFVVECRKE